MKVEFKWDTDDDWRRASTRIHAFEGLFRVEPGSKGFRSKEGVMVLVSCEAEQHLLHFGRSDAPVCWTICGLTSGYNSRSNGEEIRETFPRPAVTSGTVRPLDEVEEDYILAALELNGGNQTFTAGQLRIGSATLYRRLKNYGLIGGNRAAPRGG